MKNTFLTLAGVLLSVALLVTLLVLHLADHPAPASSPATVTDLDETGELGKCFPWPLCLSQHGECRSKERCPIQAPVALGSQETGSADACFPFPFCETQHGYCRDKSRCNADPPQDGALGAAQSCAGYPFCLLQHGYCAENCSSTAHVCDPSGCSVTEDALQTFARLHGHEGMAALQQWVESEGIPLTVEMADGSIRSAKDGCSNDSYFCKSLGWPFCLLCKGG